MKSYCNSLGYWSGMTAVLIKIRHLEKMDTHTHTHTGSTLCEDEGRDQDDISTGQGKSDCQQSTRGLKRPSLSSLRGNMALLIIPRL